MKNVNNRENKFTSVYVTSLFLYYSILASSHSYPKLPVNAVITMLACMLPTDYICCLIGWVYGMQSHVSMDFNALNWKHKPNTGLTHEVFNTKNQSNPTLSCSTVIIIDDQNQFIYLFFLFT